MKIPILVGRDFDATDEFGSTAIISRRLATRMYGSLDVIGQAFPKSNPRGKVIGVVGDARLTASEAEDGESFYVPLNPKDSTRALIVRARTNAAVLVQAMNASARTYNEDIIPNARQLSKDFATRGGDARAMSRLLGALGLLALSITCVGIFSTISYTAVLRRKEIGIRMVMGAGRSSVVLLLLKQLRWPLCAGLAFGIGAAMPAGLLFAGVPLFVKPFDPRVLAIVASSLIVTASLAAVLPARRALRSNPLQSLRSE
jgi:ABC-type antimicrobial peptide transport system permease subunit